MSNHDKLTWFFICFSRNDRLVGVLGLEPRSLAAQDFESSVFTNFTILPVKEDLNKIGHNTGHMFLAIISCRFVYPNVLAMPIFASLVDHFKDGFHRHRIKKKFLSKLEPLWA